MEADGGSGSVTLGERWAEGREGEGATLQHKALCSTSGGSCWTRIPLTLQHQKGVYQIVGRSRKRTGSPK